MQGLIERYKGNNTKEQGESSKQNKPQVSSRYHMIYLIISNNIAMLCIEEDAVFA
jgi:hypothetical protein